MLISGSEDKTVKVWDKNGKCVVTIGKIVSPESGKIEGPLDYVRSVLGISENRVVASTRDFELAIYSIFSGD